MLIFLKLLVICFCLSNLASTLAQLLPDNKWSILPTLIFGCKSCFSFWLSLILTTQLFTACAIWMVLFFYTNLLEEKITNTKL